jgi:hypothetical protein
MKTKRPDRLILVYSSDSGVRAMLVDVLKKLVGREDCALCEITYSPVGKRGEWLACEKRLGIIVDELHRDRLPDAWGLNRDQLPCILARAGEEMPFVLVSRDEIGTCRASIEQLERRIRDALQAATAPPEASRLAAVSDSREPQRSFERRSTSSRSPTRAR